MSARILGATVPEEEEEEDRLRFNPNSFVAYNLLLHLRSELIKRNDPNLKDVLWECEEILGQYVECPGILESAEAELKYHETTRVYERLAKYLDHLR